MSALGRLLYALFLALSLASCEVVETGELVGIWLDEDAKLLTCGDTYELGISLDIREDAAELRGTYSVGDTDFPFVGTREGRAVRGDISDASDEVVLVAVLTYSGATLKGSFQATEVSECAAGERSKAVYQVTMTHLNDVTEIP